MVLMKIAPPQTNIRRTFLVKLCFDFMASIVTIELGFRQQVAAEALKNPPKLAFRWRSRDGSIGAGLFYGNGNQILATKESRNNGLRERQSSRSPQSASISTIFPVAILRNSAQSCTLAAIAR